MKLLLFNRKIHRGPNNTLSLSMKGIKTAQQKVTKGIHEILGQVLGWGPLPNRKQDPESREHQLTDRQTGHVSRGGLNEDSALDSVA